MDESRKTILFVDDEIEILKTLKRNFFDKDYPCFFVNSVKEAIETLEAGGIDLIISDIRMPGKDGYYLLDYVRETFPKIPRVAISGYTDEKRVYKALESNLIKHYIMKPWKNDEIVKMIEKVFKLESKLENKKVFEVINNLESLPTLPEVYTKLNKMIDEQANMDKIGGVISKDQSIASKILKIANSGFYGLKTDSIRQAIAYIGSDNVKNIVLTTEMFEKDSIDVTSKKILWKHLEETADNVVKLHEGLFGFKPNSRILSATLFHDIGIVTMMKIFGERYGKFFKESILNGESSLKKSEKDLFGISHDELGGLLLNWWEFSYHIIETSMYHHGEFGEDIINKQMVALVHVSDMYSWHKISRGKIEIEDKILNILGTDMESLDEILHKEN